MLALQALRMEMDVYGASSMHVHLAITRLNIGQILLEKKDPVSTLCSVELPHACEGHGFLLLDEVRMSSAPMFSDSLHALISRHCTLTFAVQTTLALLPHISPSLACLSRLCFQRLFGQLAHCCFTLYLSIILGDYVSYFANQQFFFLVKDFDAGKAFSEALTETKKV